MGRRLLKPAGCNDHIGAAITIQVADAKAMVDRGDLAAARTRLEDLDKFWDGAMARSTPRPSRVGG